MNKFNVTKVVLGLLSVGVLAASFSSQAAIVDTQTVAADFTVNGPSAIALTWTGVNTLNAGVSTNNQKLGVLNVKTTGTSGNEFIVKSQHRNGIWPAFMGPDGNTLPIMLAKGDLMASVGEYAISEQQAGGSLANVDIDVNTAGVQNLVAGKYTSDLTVVLNIK